MNEKSSCPVLRGRDDGNVILLLDQKCSGIEAIEVEAATTKFGGDVCLHTSAYENRSSNFQRSLAYNSNKGYGYHLWLVQIIGTPLPDGRNA